MSTTTRKFKTVITDTGAKKLAQAAAPDGKPVRLTHMAVGDGGGTLPTPDSKQTRLVHEVWRHTVNRVFLDATHQNRIIAELVIPPETGGFWIREIGVFDEHGDLIAVGNTAESYKPTVAEGSGRAQTFRTILTVSSTATVALTVDNTMVIATVDYVDDKLKEHEQSRRHPDASLTAKGFTQLSSDTNSTSETLAATPKAVKAVMDETNKKAPLNSPALTGTPTTPTAPQGANSTQIASTAFVMAAIAALVDSSPDALNTLNELAAALGNDPNFATTMTNALAGKQPKDATLTALAELATSADKLPYFTGADRAALTALTSVGRAILGKTSTQGVLDYLGLGEGSALPAGVPVPWPSATPPSDWLKCNGARFDKNKFPELATVYPSGFLPDLRGEFIRGWDDGRGIDGGRILLSAQSHAYEEHSHRINISTGRPGIDSTIGIVGSVTGKYVEYIDQPNDGEISAIENAGGTETRPRNIAFNFIVRAA